MAQIDFQEEKQIDFQPIDFQEDVPNSAFLPGLNRVRALLAQRNLDRQKMAEGQPKTLLEAMPDIRNPGAIINNGVNALGELGTRAEATIANPVLKLQEGLPRTKEGFDVGGLVKSALEGVTGKQTVQLGDVMRNVGVPEPVAASVGLLGMLGLGNLATKGNIAPSVIGKSLPKIGGQVSKEVADIGKFIKSIPEFPKTAISRVRDYAGNKVGAIREGAKSYWKQEINAYGDAIDSMSTNKSPIDLSPLMENMTQTMVDRGLYDPVNEKWVRPLTKVDTQFVKSYSTLARQLRKTGQTDIGSIVREYQNIKNSAAIDSTLGRDARSLSNSIIGGIKDQINVDTFKQANTRYANFRNNFDQIDKAVDVWGNPIQTGRAEKFLTRRLGETKEARRTAQVITEKTGQSLKTAKALSALSRLPGMKFFR